MAQPSRDPPSDAADADAGLVRRCQDGDLAAFNELVDVHQRAIFNLCLRMLGSSQAAEDIAQEAFIAAFRTIASCRGASFRAWLMRIASNACIDEIRRRGRRPALSLDTPAAGDATPLEVVDVEAGPEELVLRGEEQARIQALLLRLPPDQRLAVVLCDIQGYSYAEIAATMRTSIGTVKSRIARGREKLRELLLGAGEQAQIARRHS